MNTLRQKCAVVILTLLLAISASANSGQIQCPSATSPQSPPSNSNPAGGFWANSRMTTAILTIISLIH